MVTSNKSVEKLLKMLLGNGKKKKAILNKYLPVKQTEKLATALGKPEKPKAKTVKVKAVRQKAPAKGGKKTDTDNVLTIINRSKKGIDTAALMKKTGFDQKKVRNMLNRTYKQGKITRVEKGIYVGVK